jgi:ferredoxin
VPHISLQKGGTMHVGEVPPESNLVVRAGIHQFPFPHLAYGCGMGKCGKCACRVLAGQATLGAPNWKETRVLGARIEQGWRLMCQHWISDDLELAQDG